MDGTTIGGPTAASRNYIGGNNNAGVLAGSTAASRPLDPEQLHRSQLRRDGRSSGHHLRRQPGDDRCRRPRRGQPLRGQRHQPFQGLLLNAGASDVQVRGNTLGVGVGGQNLGFAGAAINVYGGDNSVIGGTTAGEGNVIGNAPAGIQLANTAHDNTSDRQPDRHRRLRRPTLAARMASSSGAATGNTLGAGTAASENVISNWSGDAIRIGGDGSDENSIGRNRGNGQRGPFIDLEETSAGRQRLRQHGERPERRHPGAARHFSPANPTIASREPAVPGRPCGSTAPRERWPPRRPAFSSSSDEKVVGPAGNWKLNPAGRLKKGWRVERQPDGARRHGSSELALAKKARR